MDRNIIVKDFPEVSIIQEQQQFELALKTVAIEDGLVQMEVALQSEIALVPKPITLRWRLPAINVSGCWKPGGVYDKRLRYDWELDHPVSRVSVNAPVLSVFGFDDQNVITFATAEAINMVEMNALLREEDNHLYCHITLFAERHAAIKNYATSVRVDTRSLGFASCLMEMAHWWANQPHLKAAPVPDLARAPLYSTWYNFHQDLDPDTLLEECKLAADLGYELIILDDGWQTLDNSRGYDYTGDWKPERFPDMAAFVTQVHNTGMKFGLWFSVPFCGVKSTAYQRFKGKFLTEKHRWAPVFDPRYPEVRAYLIDIYVNALKQWNLDAFKLDFIDEFKVYPETQLTLENGRDYANVNEAVDRLMTDVMLQLRNIKPDIAIEFRQQYVGPAMRKFGNMFRAFDCPNDAVSNRVRTTDVKLLAGTTAVHSDPQTWHHEESVEKAALQLLNPIFSVPQMSIHLRYCRPDHLRMIRFYTQYWKANQSVLLDGAFSAEDPLGNYPILSAELEDHLIVGVYAEQLIQLGSQQKIDLLNAKTSSLVLIKGGELANYRLTILDCQGDEQVDQPIELGPQVRAIEVPPAGIALLRKI